MSKKIIGIMLILVLIVFVFLMGIRWEFTRYLEEKYSNLSFNVGFVKIDPFYGNFYAKVTCLEDYTVFPISKGFMSYIDDEYLQYKSQKQYNSRLREIINGSDIERYIKNIAGGGKMPFESGGVYNQINIYLIDDAEYIQITKKMMKLMEQNKISAEKIIIMYEKGQHVYEIKLSSNDYAITETEIEAKVVQKK